MLAGSLCLGASDSRCDGSVAVSFPDLADVKEAAFEAPKSGAAVDLASPSETKGGIEVCVGDCGDGGLSLEEGFEGWWVDGG